MTRCYRVNAFYDMSLGGAYDVTVSRLINRETMAVSLPLRINVEQVSPELTPEEESPESSKQP